MGICFLKMGVCFENGSLFFLKQDIFRKWGFSKMFFLITVCFSKMGDCFLKIRFCFQNGSLFFEN